MEQATEREGRIDEEGGLLLPARRLPPPRSITTSAQDYLRSQPAVRRNYPAPADTAAIVLATNRACDMDFWPNIDYLATQSPTNQSVIVDVDLNNNNTWLLNKATGIVFGALGACGLAPCPGHNAAHFAYGHMTNVDSKGNIYVS